MPLPSEAEQLFHELGLRLRTARIDRREKQADLSARAGVSRQIIIKMEQGDPAVALGKWVRVSSALGLLQTWAAVLQLPADPFAEYDRKQRQEQQLKVRRVRKG
jgi:transcriptional regulator with XRE-family HTH domain